jgi:Protein involved in catabolism of external DNA
MLSYQHGYHAGNLADVHKHATLASAIQLLTQKEKPLSYIETHSGRALYDLTSEFALKTGEAEAGILTVDSRGWFEASHPYAVARRAVQAAHGESTYPGHP